MNFMKLLKLIKQDQNLSDNTDLPNAPNPSPHPQSPIHESLLIFPIKSV